MPVLFVKMLPSSPTAPGGPKNTAIIIDISIWQPCSYQVVQVDICYRYDNLINNHLFILKPKTTYIQRTYCIVQALLVLDERVLTVIDYVDLDSLIEIQSIYPIALYEIHPYHVRHRLWFHEF